MLSHQTPWSHVATNLTRPRVRNVTLVWQMTLTIKLNGILQLQIIFNTKTVVHDSI